MILKVWNSAKDEEKALDKEMEIIRDNYLNPIEFKCIFEHYESVIRSLVNKNKEDVSKVSLSDFIKDIETPIDSTDNMFQVGDSSFETIKNFAKSLVHYSTFNLDSKTTESHNIRKSSILSLLYLFHKLRLNGSSIDLTKRSNFLDLCLSYAKKYASVTSMIFDLKPYFVYFNNADKDEFISALKEVSEECLEKAEDKEKAKEDRYTRMRLSYWKSIKMLGLDLIKHEAEILNEYKEVIELEKKPEQGERRISDDYLLILEEAYEDNDESPSLFKASSLRRIILLEKGLAISPYNFDLNLKLVKIYECLGISEQYKRVHSVLTLKGILLESIGFMGLRFSMFSLGDDFFNSWCTKYQTFRKRNGNDLM